MSDRIESTIATVLERVEKESGMLVYTLSSIEEALHGPEPSTSGEGAAEEGLLARVERCLTNVRAAQNRATRIAAEVGAGGAKYADESPRAQVQDGLVPRRPRAI